ncbi:hypothetical protein O181_107779 [Austropuccinia psidii MF-1]|uniref:Uncharacterized protein n=1 Tax=Austropuccinia psidii MF-1 TaxID=1389203 RepID=A0A9Q3JTR0_9BASI|nr:hypothetical protein [Austropuccinia psidii MF-1]
MLTHLQPPPDEPPTLPPISTLTTPYASTPPPLTLFTLLQCPQDETTIRPSPLLTLPHPCLIFSLAYNLYTPAGPQVMPLTPPSPPLIPTCTCHLPSLCLWSASPTCLQCHLPSLCLYSALPTCLRHHLPSLHL